MGASIRFASSAGIARSAPSSARYSAPTSSRWLSRLRSTNSEKYLTIWATIWGASSSKVLDLVSVCVGDLNPRLGLCGQP
jgi:hypothetical protein